MSLAQCFNLQGQTALITGAGRGIGRAIALSFAEAGARVVCSARTLADVEAVADQIRRQGGDALALACDVTIDQQRAALVEQSLKHYGRLTLLVNNAGGSPPNDPLRTSADQFNAVLQFNLTQAYDLSTRVATHMLASGGGSIINISSSAARYSQKNFSAYGTAKAALNQMTRLLAAEFAPHIRVNAIAPGAIMTDALAQFLDESATQRMLALTPLASMGMPEDIAAAAVFLASPAARWVTGKILEVDGGAESSTWPF